MRIGHRAHPTLRDARGPGRTRRGDPAPGETYDGRHWARLPAATGWRDPDRSSERCA